jgi:hypothetical protein
MRRRAEISTENATGCANTREKRRPFSENARNDDGERQCSPGSPIVGLAEKSPRQCHTGAEFRCVSRDGKLGTAPLGASAELPPPELSQADGGKHGTSVDIGDNDLSPRDGRWCRNFLSRSRAKECADDRVPAQVPLVLARVRNAHPLARDTLSFDSAGFSGIRSE